MAHRVCPGGFSEYKQQILTARKRYHINPGDGTSADHIISHRPGLIPQVTGRHTHENFGGAVTIVDHATSFDYLHLIKGVTVDDTVAAKETYER
eukprot:12994893-Ditylum_brightwellii.AAC.1